MYQIIRAAKPLYSNKKADREHVYDEKVLTNFAKTNINKYWSVQGLQYDRQY